MLTISRRLRARAVSPSCADCGFFHSGRLISRISVRPSWIYEMSLYPLCHPRPAVSAALIISGPTDAPTPHMQCSQLMWRLA